MLPRVSGTPRPGWQTSPMTTYLVVTAKINDLALLNEYQAGAGPTLAGHPVTPIVVTNDAEVLEGTPPGGRCVILGFPDRDALMAWYNSDAYQAVIGKRHSATEGFAMIVEGF